MSASFKVFRGGVLQDGDFFEIEQLEDGITASVTQTQGQQPLTKSLNFVTVVANNDDTVTAPAASIGRVLMVVNDGANRLQVFPASGDDLGEGVDQPVKIKTGRAREWLGRDDTNWM